MKPRLLLAAALSLSLLPCLALVGCGAPPRRRAPEAAAGRRAPSPPPRSKWASSLSAADIAEAQAEMELVADEERAYQSQNPVGRRVGRGR